jgi:hypothetical protein
MIRTVALAAALAAAVTAMPAAAQEQPAVDDKVVVQGTRAEDAVRAFVAEVGTSPDGTNLARWDRTICVGATNLSPDYAQKLIDRVSLVALAVGLEPGEPGCKANVLVMADIDGDALASRLVSDLPHVFRPPETHATNMGRDALKVFKTSDAPVRWWHVSQTVLADTGAAYLPGSSVRVRSAGRLRSNVRQEMSHALIILDASRIGTISFGSLADYVAMVALAQVDAEADTREFPSVLNLFDSEVGARNTRLTQWDLDYLVALYEVPGDASSAGREANHIARKMLEEPASTN